MATVQKNTNGNTVIFSDGTEAEFSSPTEIHLGLALAMLKKDPLGMVDVIVDNCLVKGDKDELKDNLSYCKQLSDLMDDLFGKIKAVLDYDVLNGEPVSTVTFQNGIFFILKKCDRKTYSASRTKSAQNPIQGIKHILANCIISDDDIDPAIFKNPGIILGFSEIVEQYLEDTGKRLGN